MTDFLTLPLSNLLERGAVKTGKAVEIKGNTVILADGETIAFDYCVLAIGSSNSLSNIEAFMEGDTKEVGCLSIISSFCLFNSFRW